MAWLARDRNGQYCLFKEKPNREIHEIHKEQDYWNCSDLDEKVYLLVNKTIEKIFNIHLKWENEPIEIEIKIK